MKLKPKEMKLKSNLLTDLGDNLYFHLVSPIQNSKKWKWHFLLLTRNERISFAWYCKIEQENKKE